VWAPQLPPEQQYGRTAFPPSVACASASVAVTLTHFIKVSRVLRRISKSVVEIVDKTLQRLTAEAGLDGYFGRPPSSPPSFS
jgi:hypothetical protein